MTEEVRSKYCHYVGSKIAFDGSTCPQSCIRNRIECLGRETELCAIRQAFQRGEMK